MGCIYEAICNRCNTRFEVNEGPGMLFFLAKCSKCGKEKSLGIHEIMDAGVDWGDADGINKLAGSCACGGTFDINAKSRCPKCNSDSYHEAPNSLITHYD